MNHLNFRVWSKESKCYVDDPSKVIIMTEVGIRTPSDNFIIEPQIDMVSTEGQQAFIGDIVEAKVVDKKGQHIGNYRGVFEFSDKNEIVIETDVHDFPVISFLIIDSFSIIGNRNS